jgi:hypothetical protein
MMNMNFKMISSLMVILCYNYNYITLVVGGSWPSCRGRFRCRLSGPTSDAGGEQRLSGEYLDNAVDEGWKIWDLGQPTGWVYLHT